MCNRVQEDDPYADNLLQEMQQVEEMTQKTEAAATSEQARTSEEEPEESEESDEDDDDDNDDNDEDPTNDTSDNDGQQRRKRQIDLSSHTQDGVPIYDRGYFAHNRTEGLRIYQSLLSNGPRSDSVKSPAIHWGSSATSVVPSAGGATTTPSTNTAAVTEQPVPNHARQNHFWRGQKKEKVGLKPSKQRLSSHFID